METSASLASRLYSSLQPAVQPTDAVRQTRASVGDGGFAGAAASFIDTIRQGEQVSKGELLYRVEQRVLAFLKGRLTGFETQRQEFQNLLARYGEQVGEYPALERKNIARALVRMQTHTQAHLRSRLGPAGRAGMAGKPRLPRFCRVYGGPLRRRLGRLGRRLGAWPANR